MRWNESPSECPVMAMAAPVRRVARFGLAGVALLMLFGAMPLGAQSRLVVQVSPIAEIVSGLGEAEASVRFDFAALAVEALVSAYEGEVAAVIGQRPRTSAEQVRLATWRRATESFLGELRVAQASLHVATDVTVQMDRHGQIVILIDGRPFWITWPRVNTQAALEGTLAREFCRRHSCSASATATSMVADTWPTVGGSWVLAQGRSPAWQSDDGVRCEFPDLRERAARESVCAAVVLDLRALAGVIEAAVTLGAAVQWNAVMLDSDVGSARQRIRVNEQGEFVEVSVPALANSGIDWQAAGHWLRLRILGGGGRVGVTVLRSGAETHGRTGR